MEGQIAGHVLGVDTVATLSGTNSVVVRVLKVAVESVDIDWGTASPEDLQIAMVPFAQIFYQELHVNSAVQIDGELQVRKALPPGEQQHLAKHLEKIQTRTIGTLRVWIKRYHLQAQQKVLEKLMMQYLDGQFKFNDLMLKIQKAAWGDAAGANQRIDKLNHALHPILQVRAALVAESPAVFWFVTAATIQSQASSRTTDSGPLQVIRLDQHSLEDSWAQWQKEMAQADQ